MMKNKIIAVLLLATAGFGQDAQSMGGAVRKFGQSFARVKQGVATRIKALDKTELESEPCHWSTAMVSYFTFIGVAISAYSYDKEKRVLRDRPPLARLAPEVDNEIKVFFKKHGFSVQILESDSVGLAVGYEYSDKKCANPQLRLGSLEASILAHEQLDVCQGKTTITLKKDHVMSVLGHEVDHLIHKDMQVKRELFGDGLLTNVFRALGWISKEEAAFGRAYEERCDRNAPYNVAGKDADPEVLAYHAENLAHYMKFCVPEEEQRLKELVNPEMLTDFLDRATHPLPSVRVAYLKELAAEFRAKKTMAFKVAAFAKQQRTELGKLFRGEFKK